MYDALRSADYDTGRDMLSPFGGAGGPETVQTKAGGGTSVAKLTKAQKAAIDARYRRLRAQGKTRDEAIAAIKKVMGGEANFPRDYVPPKVPQDATPEPQGGSSRDPMEGGKSEEPNASELPYVPYAEPGGAKTPAPKKPEAQASPEAEVTPLKVAGFSLGAKFNADGVEVAVSEELSVSTPPIYIAPNVFVEVTGKIGVKGAVAYSHEKGWSGKLTLGVGMELAVKGGLPWANVYGVGKLGVELDPTIGKNGLGQFSGPMTGELAVGAEVTLPWDEAANFAAPDEWKRTAGLKFEYSAWKGKLANVTVTKDGIKVDWAAGRMDHAFIALKAWRDEYSRNMSGGGASGGPGSYPDEKKPGGGGAGGAGA